MTCRTCEDAAFLAGTDHFVSIARRPGYGHKSPGARSGEYLIEHLRRHGQHDLANRLNRTEQGALT